jgi:hypothetical protein
VHPPIAVLGQFGREEFAEDIGGDLLEAQEISVPGADLLEDGVLSIFPGQSTGRRVSVDLIRGVPFAQDIPGEYADQFEMRRDVFLDDDGLPGRRRGRD